MKKPRAASPAKKKVLIVDDHPLLREGLCRIINQQTDLTICGEAGNAQEALVAVRKRKPDVVVMDLSMPGRDGLELLKDLKAYDRHLLVLVLSMHDETLYAERALRAGARGYVMKSAPMPELVRAIQRVAAGEFVLGRQIVGQLAARSAAGAKPSMTTPQECLTDRELEVYRLLGQGRQRAEIAAQLHLSPKTIETHRDNIRHKLGMRNATELRQHAMEFLREEAGGLEYR